MNDQKVLQVNIHTKTKDFFFEQSYSLQVLQK